MQLERHVEPELLSRYSDGLNSKRSRNWVSIPGNGNGDSFHPEHEADYPRMISSDVTNFMVGAQLRTGHFM